MPSGASCTEGGLGKVYRSFCCFRRGQKEARRSIAEGGRTGEVRFLGDVENSPLPIERLIKKLADRYKQSDVNRLRKQVVEPVFRQIKLARWFR